MEKIYYVYYSENWFGFRKKKKKKTYNGSSAPTSDGPPNTWSSYSEHFSLRKSVNYVFSNPSGISGLEETWNKLYRAIFCLENAAPLLLWGSRNAQRMHFKNITSGVIKYKYNYNWALKMTVSSSSPKPTARPISSPSRMAPRHVPTHTTCRQTPEVKRGRRIYWAK